MEQSKLDEERLELDKKTIHREDLRRVIEVCAHAIKLTKDTDSDLRKSLIGTAKKASDELNKTLTGLV